MPNERRITMASTEGILPAAPTVLCTLRGHITRCAEPASGHRIVCWHRREFGLPGGLEGCEIQPSVLRRVGEVTVDGNGDFAFTFSALGEPFDACYFSSVVRVDVFDGATLVWASGLRNLESSVRFDRELVPGCLPDRTTVRVVDELGRAAPGAEVYVNGRLRRTTDATGYAFFDPPLAAGDRLVARLLVHENSTSRDGHDVDSGQNWNYRVYLTSLRVRHDADGDDVELPQHAVEDPAQTHVLWLARGNTLIGLNLRASVEWDATSLEYQRYRDRLADMSELLYNATDGQMLIERLAVTEDGRSWDDADIRIFANLNQSSTASVGGLFGDSGFIRMNPNDAHFAGTLMHELGHYAFGVLDEYEDGEDTSDGPPCTLRSLETDGPYGDGFGKDSCFMRGARNGVDGRNQKKLCSLHPDNRHAPGTEQGPVDCWSDLVDRFGDASRWRLLTPVSRNAIVDRLPDSGEPLRGSTEAPDSHDRPRSFIPLRDWKTAISPVFVHHAGLCDGLVLRARLRGVPVAGARVWLRTAQGRQVYQGATRVENPYRLAYGVATGPGEIPLRGVHVGDRLSVSATVAGEFALAQVVVDGCEQTVVANLQPVVLGQLELEDQLAAAMPARGPVIRSVSPERRWAVASADGRLRLVLPEGSLPAPGQLVLEERPDLLATLPPGGEVLSGPYAVSSSAGDTLATPATIRFGVPDSEAPDPDDVAVLARYADRDWRTIPSTVTPQPFVVSSGVDRLGAWALQKVTASPGQSTTGFGQ
jgi:hypothetical protein